MRIHILGICGTFMGGLAQIAKQLGHEVSGSDAAIYPPMSTQLEELGVKLFNGYFAENLQLNPDLVIIGNAIRRLNPEAEFVLNNRIPYMSGPEWLYKYVLQNRVVLAVSGTHGKTTTTAMLAWILQSAGKNPGFLIGGVPKDFESSAQLGDAPYFVIEADEYDTAFFDKRSKFISYRPNILIMNNLEFDHGDIFKDLEAIKIQFSHLVRTIPSNGLIIYPHKDSNIEDVLSRGCWTERETFGNNSLIWNAANISDNTEEFEVFHNLKFAQKVSWKLLGLHNINNALAAIAAANRIGIEPKNAILALNNFSGLKRRLEIKGVINNITVYDDFAHHPTAIEATIKALRAKVKNARIIAILEFGSNTMLAGMHKEKVFTALNSADFAFVLRPKTEWDIDSYKQASKIPTKICDTIEAIILEALAIAKPHDHILIMSNKSFGGIHERLLKGIKEGL